MRDRRPSIYFFFYFSYQNFILNCKNTVLTRDAPVYRSLFQQILPFPELVLFRQHGELIRLLFFCDDLESFCKNLWRVPLFISGGRGLLSRVRFTTIYIFYGNLCFCEEIKLVSLALSLACSIGRVRSIAEIKLIPTPVFSEAFLAAFRANSHPS